MSRTNYEKIRDMSVEEMAEFLLDVATENADCMTGEISCKWENSAAHNKGCGNCFREWLEKEAEDDEISDGD